MKRVGRSSCLGVVIDGEMTSVKSASVKSLAVPKYEMTAFLSKIVDTTGIIPDHLYLSECVVPTLRLYHLLTMIQRFS